MAAPVGSLVVKVGSDVSQLVIGFDKGKKETRAFGASVKKVAKVLTGLGVAAAATGLALATKFTKDGLDSIDMMTKLGRTVGATQAEMVALTRTFERVGLSQEQVQSTIQRFTKRLGEALEGTGTAAKALDELGLSAEKLVAVPLPEALGIVAAEIQKLGGAAEKSALAADLFGRRGLALALATDDLAGQIALSTKEVNKFGVAVSQLDAENIEEAQDALSALNLVFKGVANQAAVVLAPALVEISESIQASSAATTGFRAAILDTFKIGVQAAFAFQDALRFVEIAGKSTALSFLEAARFFQKLNPTSTMEELRDLGFQIQGLQSEIFKLVDMEGGETRAEEFFKRLEERIEKAREALNTVTTGEDVGDPLGILDESQDARLEAIDKFNNARLEKEEKAQSELTAVEKRWQAARKRFEEIHFSEKVATVSGALASVTAAFADQNKEMFNINKAFQIADAVVNGIAGAIRTWNSVPYPWNIPLTALHVAGTAAQIANLSSQQFQGGRSGGATVPTGGPVPGPGGGGDGGGGGVAQSVNISLVGDRFGRTQVRDLIEEINDAVADGAQLRVV